MTAKEIYNANDKEANQKARIATAITAMLMVIALLFITLSVDAKKDEDEEGILVNFGTSNVGRGQIQPQQKAEEPLIQPKKNEVQETPPPPKPQPKTSQPAVKQKEVLTQKEETAVVSKPKKTTPKQVDTPTPTKEVSKPNESTKPSDSDSNTPSPSPTTQPKPVQKQPDRVYGGKSNVPSSGEGNDSQAGDKGQPDGSADKGAYEGTNSGLGDSGVGYSLSGRKLIQAPSVSDNSNIEGKVTVNIKVDQNGNVISASLGKPTTISNNSLIQKSIAAAKRAKFDKNRTASEEQFGTMTFVYRVR